MRPLLFLAPSVFAIVLAGCGNSATQTDSGEPNASQRAVQKASGADYTLTTQTYDSAAGSYGDSRIQHSASRDQIESAIRSMDWSPGPIRPMVKLVRSDGNDITAYLQIKRDQESGDTIIASWQSVADENQFTRTTTLSDEDAVLKVALAFANGDDLSTVANWANQ